MDFKKGERVGISKLLGRGGPLWRPGTITGPSPSPHWDYTIEYDDKYGKFLNATRSHVIKWTQYEAWLKKNEKKQRKTTSPTCVRRVALLRSRLRFFAKDRSRPIFVSVAIRWSARRPHPSC